MRLVESTRDTLSSKIYLKEAENKPGRLAKYFERDREADFSDDGARFTCYKYIPEGSDGSISFRISKTTYEGEYFISARLNDSNDLLTYDEYSKLPHYRGLDEFNGTYSFTDEDAQKLKNTMDEYYKEYAEAAGSAEEPDNEAFLNYHRNYNKVAKEYYAKALEEIKKVDIAKMSPFDLKEIQDALSTLKHAAKDLDEKKLSSRSNANKRDTLRRNEEYNPYWYNKILNSIKEICEKTEDNDPHKYSIGFKYYK